MFRLGKKNKAKSLGFQAKQRTRQEVDADYSQAAVLLGHKTRVLAQINEDAERIEREIKTHLDDLLRLNAEGMKLPPQEAPAAPVAEETKEGA